jgi:putative copper export protein
VATLTVAVRRRAGDVAEMDGLARRVSRVAGLSVAALAVAGGYQALVLVGSPSALLGTAYGRAVTVKVAALALAVLVAAATRARSLRTSPGTAGPGDWSFARSRLRVELGLIVAAAATTGLLVTLAPPAGSTPAGVTSSVSLDDDPEPALQQAGERRDGRAPDTSTRT